MLRELLLISYHVLVKNLCLSHPSLFRFLLFVWFFYHAIFSFLGFQHHHISVMNHQSRPTGCWNPSGLKARHSRLPPQTLPFLRIFSVYFFFLFLPRIHLSYVSVLRNFNKPMLCTTCTACTASSARETPFTVVSDRSRVIKYTRTPNPENLAAERKVSTLIDSLHV